MRESLSTIGDGLDPNRTGQAIRTELEDQKVASASVERVRDQLDLVCEGQVDEALFVESLADGRDPVAAVGERSLPVVPSRDVEETGHRAQPRWVARSPPAVCLPRVASWLSTRSMSPLVALCSEGLSVMIR